VLPGKKESIGAERKEAMLEKEEAEKYEKLKDEMAERQVGGCHNSVLPGPRRTRWPSDR
jgi:hypothetical protein